MIPYIYLVFSKFAQVNNCTNDQLPKFNDQGQLISGDPSCQTTLPNIAADSGHLHTILQLIFGVIAAATVIFIIISAIRFVMSQGEPDKVANARNAVVFACIGLAVALSAEIIVTFVLNNF